MKRMHLTCILLLLLCGSVPAVMAGEAYQHITTWGGAGSGPGLFNYPTGIAVDGAGNIYVADLVQLPGPGLQLHGHLSQGMGFAGHR